MVGFECYHHGERLLNCCVMYYHTYPEPGIMVWGNLAINLFKQDKTRSHVARNVQDLFFTNQIELFPWTACSPDLSVIENVWSMLAQRLSRDRPPAATTGQRWQYVEATWIAVPQALYPKPL
ncbi:transposable element Tcb1 transposase [Trichonephila clavipes]|nr:transposable element Tcb1 transposase [Trichonephila clavipes]